MKCRSNFSATNFITKEMANNVEKVEYHFFSSVTTKFIIFYVNVFRNMERFYRQFCILDIF